MKKLFSILMFLFTMVVVAEAKVSVTYQDVGGTLILSQVMPADDAGYIADLTVTQESMIYMMQEPNSQRVVITDQLKYPLFKTDSYTLIIYNLPLNFPVTKFLLCSYRHKANDMELYQNNLIPLVEKRAIFRPVTQGGLQISLKRIHA